MDILHRLWARVAELEHYMLQMEAVGCRDKVFCFDRAKEISYTTPKSIDTALQELLDSHIKGECLAPEKRA